MRNGIYNHSLLGLFLNIILSILLSAELEHFILSGTQFSSESISSVIWVGSGEVVGAVLVATAVACSLVARI